MANESREQLRVKSSSESARQASEKPVGAQEIKEKTSRILKAESAEAAETSEGVELSEGKVSEGLGEDKAQAPVGGAKRSYTADEIEAIRAKLLAALPSQAIMVKQIKNTLYAQEKKLTKKMKKMGKKAHKYAFELNIVVAQLRKIREYFSVLAHATYEVIKTLWLKIVHGV